jgi:hypothetical protein
MERIRPMPDNFREQWARSWLIVVWAGFLATVGATSVPVLLSMREAEWTAFGVLVLAGMFVEHWALPRAGSGSWVPSLFYVPRINAWANRVRARKGLPPLPERKPPRGVRRRGIRSIIWTITLAGIAGVVLEFVHVILHAIADAPLAALWLGSPLAAVVTWCWLRGSERRPAQAAQYGQVSGLVLGVAAGYITWAVSPNSAGRLAVLWALVIAYGILWSFLGLAGGMVISRGVATKFKAIWPISLMAASGVAISLMWAFRIPITVPGCFAALMLGAGWGVGVLVGQDFQTEATGRAALHPASPLAGS